MRAVQALKAATSANTEIIHSRLEALVKIAKDIGLEFFFFQAEDDIRDRLVTGVQTCVFRSGIAKEGAGYSGYRQQYVLDILLASLRSYYDLIEHHTVC